MDLQTLSALSTLYNEPHRHYHNLGHIHYCLRKLDEYVKDNGQPAYLGAIRTALWFHDAVYDPYATGGANERQSAALAVSYVNKHASHYESSFVEELILATAHHTEDQDLAYKEFGIFLDIDLSGLGDMFHGGYSRNTAEIFREYPNVEFDQFLVGRKAFLETMLKRKRIFYTDYFFDKLEKNARMNIDMELERLVITPLWYKRLLETYK